MKNVNPLSIDKLYFDAMEAEVKLAEAAQCLSDAYQAIEYHPVEYPEGTPEDAQFDTSDVEISARSTGMAGLESLLTLINQQVHLTRTVRMICAHRSPYLLERHEV